MKRNPILRQRVLANCRGYQRQFQEKVPNVQTYAKTSPDVLYDLLENVQGPNKPYAKKLLEAMSRTPWQITATAHEGGHGGAGRAPDRFLHITLRVIGTHHLRCKVGPAQQLYVYEITT